MVISTTLNLKGTAGFFCDLSIDASIGDAYHLTYHNDDAVYTADHLCLEQKINLIHVSTAVQLRILTKRSDFMSFATLYIGAKKTNVLSLIEYSDY